ncbi:hypothetical protein JQS43_22985 [Natronosporangium hydrolyticum]|uniref:Uncharacterized protein n=1 Tax=Natronosporangium hydrolyticum TaxID=2811111 RepID=A0A895YKG7_9ACTN|nr:hypothetical protein [Natronosporangium hydrolyticum]QSB14328.1 hypothetical protein JQS43_22985 [Natronosporangium hydrolyticum]
MALLTILLVSGGCFWTTEEDDPRELAIDQAVIGLDRQKDGEQAAAATIRVMQQVAEEGNRYREPLPQSTVDLLVDLAIVWMDAFGQATIPESVSMVVEDQYPAITTGMVGIHLSGSDRQGFLEFLAGSGDVTAARFRAAAVDYQRELLAGTLRNEDLPRHRQMLRHLGLLDGHLSIADYHWALESMVGVGENRSRAIVVAERRRGCGIEVAFEVDARISGAGGIEAGIPGGRFVSSNEDGMIQAAIEETLGRGEFLACRSYTDDPISEAESARTPLSGQQADRHYLLTWSASGAGMLDMEDPAVQTLHPENQLISYHDLLSSDDVLTYLMALEDVRGLVARQHQIDLSHFDEAQNLVYNSQVTR